jgi:septum formation topological specificity factor MinE
LRSKLEFEIVGTDIDELKRRALQVVSEYVKIDDLEEVESMTEMEMSVKAEIALDEFGENQINYFVAKVWARIR